MTHCLIALLNNVAYLLLVEKLHLHGDVFTQQISGLSYKWTCVGGLGLEVWGKRLLLCHRRGLSRRMAQIDSMMLQYWMRTNSDFITLVTGYLVTSNATE